MRIQLPLLPLLQERSPPAGAPTAALGWTTGHVTEQPREDWVMNALPVWCSWRCHCAGSELVIGPWSHSGFLDNRVGHVRSGRRSRFNHLTHAVSFFDRCCGHTTDAETMAELAGADATDSTKGANRLPVSPKSFAWRIMHLQSGHHTYCCRALCSELSR